MTPAKQPARIQSPTDERLKKLHIELDLVRQELQKMRQSGTRADQLKLRKAELEDEIILHEVKQKQSRYLNLKQELKVLTMQVLL
jgi:hypothetical protein